MCKECDDDFDTHLEESARGRVIDDKRKFQAGDVVELACDGPEMVIDSINVDTEYADCTWFPQDQFGNYLEPLERTFHVSSLVLIEAVEDRS